MIVVYVFNAIRVFLLHEAAMEGNTGQRIAAVLRHGNTFYPDATLPFSV